MAVLNRRREQRQEQPPEEDRAIRRVHALRKRAPLIESIGLVELRILEELLNALESHTVKEGAWMVPHDANAHEGQFYSMRRLGAAARKSARTARRAVLNLERLGLITRFYRGWSASQFQIHEAQINALADYYGAKQVKADQERRAEVGKMHAKASAAARLKLDKDGAPLTGLDLVTATMELQASTPPPVATGWRQTVIEPRPPVAIIRGVEAWPQLVPWALRVAEQIRGAMTDSEIPAWLRNVGGLAALALAALKHPGANPGYLVEQARAQGNGRLGALWRDLACPDARTLCEEVALVAWAEGAGALGELVELKGNQGYRLFHPRSSSVWRPAQFPRYLERAQRAWAKAVDAMLDEATPTRSQFIAGGWLVDHRYGSLEWSEKCVDLLFDTNFSDVWPEVLKLAGPVKELSGAVDEHHRMVEALSRGRPPDRPGGA
ncbi:hypothetical protein L6R46_06105 [Myxococcota bacterium]|nr:hypothetical protein [Myxococcota bacterium]